MESGTRFGTTPSPDWIPTGTRLAATGVAAVALLAALWRLGRARAGVDFFADDAYYYIVIARNLADTGRATFDGVTRTNGFHPLLLWLEAAGFRTFGTSAPPLATYLAISAALAVIFVLACLAPLLAALRGRGTPANRVLLAVSIMVFGLLVLPRFMAIFLGGMESILVLPLLLVTGWFAWRARYLLAGVFGALLTLARLDTLPYLLAPLALVILWRERRARRPAIRAGLQLLGPSVIGVALFSLANLHDFGHPLPISGSLKSTFPRIHLQLRNFFGNCEERLGLRTSVLGALFGLGLLARRRNLPDDLRGLGLTAAGLALIQALALALFQRWSKGTPNWYLAEMLPLGATALGLGLANVLSVRRLEQLAGGAAAGALAVNLAWFAGKAGLLGIPVAPSLPLNTAASGPLEATFRFIDSRPRSAVWASSDCGKFAFWSGRRFVNLDGLVNDFAYQDRLRDRQLRPYLSEMAVRYLVFGAWTPVAPGATADVEPVYRYRVAPAVYDGTYQAQDYYLYSYRWSAYSDSMALPRTAEIWRSTGFVDGPFFVKLVVFDLSRVGPNPVPGAGAGGAVQEH